jgi:hypothetical protein
MYPANIGLVTNFFTSERRYVSPPNPFSDERTYLNMKSLLTLAFLCLVTTITSAQTPLRDLTSEVSQGRMELRSLAGNGSSSGAAIEGELTNLSSNSIALSVNLAEPIFLVNNGSAQNMVVSAIYPASGSYRRDRRGSFLQIGPKASIRVILIAYCADFEKENPGAQDRFQVGPLPENLQPVMRRIQTFARRNPDQDITGAAQAALWIAQGVNVTEIRRKFPVSAADERLARSFLQ